MGAMPEWYPLMRAARWLGVEPWELARQPQIWQERALIAENAEIAARRGPKVTERE